MGTLTCGVGSRAVMVIQIDFQDLRKSIYNGTINGQGVKPCLGKSKGRGADILPITQARGVKDAHQRRADT